MSYSSGSGLKLASVPTISCTTLQKVKSSSENTSEEDGSWLLDHQVPKR